MYHEESKGDSREPTCKLMLACKLPGNKRKYHILWEILMAHNYFSLFVAVYVFSSPA